MIYEQVWAFYENKYELSMRTSMSFLWEQVWAFYENACYMANYEEICTGSFNSYIS